MLLAVALSIDVLSMGGYQGSTPEAGWTTNLLSNYSEKYNFALQFNLKESYLRSPVFPYRLRALDLQVSSSSSNNTTRFLSVVPILQGEVRQDLAIPLKPSPDTHIPTFQTISFDNNPIYQFQLQYTGSKRNMWALYALTIHYNLPFVIHIR